MILDPTPKLLAMPADEYHRDDSRVSNSMLGAFLKDPLLYFRRYVAEPRVRHEPTPEMNFGTVVHHILLEDDREPKPYAVYRGEKRRGSKEWNEWVGDCYRRIVLKADEYDAACRVVDGVRANKTARWLIGSATHREAVIHWHDPIINIALKSRLDVWVEPSGIVADIKTTSGAVTPAAFAATAYRFGYDRQAAFYVDAVLALTKAEPSFVFIAVQKEPPFRCRVFELDETFVDRGRTKNLRALGELKECMRTGRWDIAAGDEIISIAEPRWAKYEDEYLTSEV